MDAARATVDLEKELTCSICTEVLYQPLTLLDCLHTFCGSCLKDWFGWQATAAENSPNPPAAGTNIATCPSCRAQVRDTRHNATVATLLEMFLRANPDKARSDAELREMQEKYKQGDDVLPRMQSLVKSPEERRLDRLERQMLEQAREMSLRDVGVESSTHETARQRRERRTRHLDGSSRSDRESSRDSRTRDARDHAPRASRGEARRRRTATNPEGMLRPGGGSSSEESRHRRNGSPHRSRESSRNRRRAVEHQASIRSLISASDVDSHDMEREVEEFARQIQEEGLLDGLDLDNIDLSQNDELSRRITEAYRRRQAQRSRHEPSRRSPPVGQAHRTEVASSSSRPQTSDNSRPSSRHRANSAHVRSSSTTEHAESRNRPPVTSTHLDIRDGRRRRTSSTGRSATDPVRPSNQETRPAARSQTDLPLRAQTSDSTSRRPSVAEARSSSLPSGGPSGSQHPTRSTFSERASAGQGVASPPPDSPALSSGGSRPKRRPAEIVVSSHNPLPSLGLPSSPPSGHARTRSMSEYYVEPSISCSQCARHHIEYELHYNCSLCNGGNWNICLDCYRSGKGCLHWFGFGWTAFKRWEKMRAQRGHLEDPHMLTSNRFLPPKIMAGGAEGRRTMTTDNPLKRLQSGMFCARCLSWANECFWRCDSCNEGDWGFCNDCVNQGRSCTHPLLPLTYVPPPNAPSPPPSPRSPRPPASASLGPNAISIGNFRSLTFTTTCDICRTAIAPTQTRHHCYSCTSTVVPDTQPGDYDICNSCYSDLASDRRISADNGPAGWRRCPSGHRMVIIGYEDNRSGQRRFVAQDLVGGHGLRIEAYEPPGEDRQSGLQRWWWYGPGHAKLERIVTRDVAAQPPPGLSGTSEFPPDGGLGMRATASWAWYPEAGSDDELLFPRGAEIREVEDVNGDWCHGSYMGVQGLFPAPYVRLIDSPKNDGAGPR